MLLTLIDAAVSKVRALSVNKKTTLRNLYCMVKNCSPQIYACVSDPNCKAALDCLEKCGLNDQVCSYQCIVTYESDKFEAFTLCNLLKHNCLENKASVPTLPAVPAMERWRGEAVTHELAEQVFIGHLDVPDRAPWLQSPRLKWSWKVVCGQNPAYDSASARSYRIAPTLLGSRPGLTPAIPSPLRRVPLPTSDLLLRQEQEDVLVSPPPCTRSAATGAACACAVLSCACRAAPLQVRPGVPGDQARRGAHVAEAPLRRAAGEAARDVCLQVSPSASAAPLRCAVVSRV